MGLYCKYRLFAGLLRVCNEFSRLPTNDQVQSSTWKGAIEAEIESCGRIWCVHTLYTYVFMGECGPWELVC